LRSNGSMVFCTGPYWLRAVGRANIRIQRSALRAAADTERWASRARVVVCKLQQLIQGLLAALAPISAVANAHADTTTTATFRGRSLYHVTLSVSDVERSRKFYARLLGGTISFETEKEAQVEGANLALPDCFMGFYKLGEPRVHHFCVGVEDFSIEAALEKLKRDFPESEPTIYRGEELYFRDPDGILGQVSGIDYRGQRKIP